MEIKVVKLEESTLFTSQGFKRLSIFNNDNIENGKIALEYVILPKGAESLPHAHIDTHTVVFTLEGSVRIFFGNNLEKEVFVNKHDCVYIPPDIIHYVVNEDDKDMIAIVARTPSFHTVKEFENLLDLIQLSN